MSCGSRKTISFGKPFRTYKLPASAASPEAHHAYFSVPETPKLPQRIPYQSWDSHMHVVDPARYPLSAKALYTPHPHSLADAEAFEATLGISNVVLVQPSIYGFDNSCLLDALRELGPHRGRGVVVIDPDNIDPRELAQWHALGVRGVRVNLKSVGSTLSGEELKATLLRHADVIRPFGWAIQVYMPLNSLPDIEECIPQLGVKFVVDHFGTPDLSSVAGRSTFNPYDIPGFGSLVRLLRAGQTYVKISGPYRFSTDPEMKDVRILLRELLSVARNRVVYATDWPHTRFEDTDIRPFTELCLQLCGDDKDLVDRLFRRNAEELWDIQR
ncbi:hypothetical protein VTN49DRAFT_2796 [Thermomyces lanuginosus]|uniref:uncharacterized protein n=1 Tax=Thermomyces lanuginosus TaxID=5541 RepID=UPI003742E799